MTQEYFHSVTQKECTRNCMRASQMPFRVRNADEFDTISTWVKWIRKMSRVSKGKLVRLGTPTIQTWNMTPRSSCKFSNEDGSDPVCVERSEARAWEHKFRMFKSRALMLNGTNMGERGIGGRHLTGTCSIFSDRTWTWWKYLHKVKANCCVQKKHIFSICCRE